MLADQEEDRSVNTNVAVTDADTAHPPTQEDSAGILTPDQAEGTSTSYQPLLT